MDGEFQAVVFRLGRQRFGIGITSVREVLDLPPVTPLFRVPACLLGVVNLRGDLVAILDLAALLGMALDAPEDAKSSGSVLIVETTGDDARRSAGLKVDQVLEVLMITVDSIDPAPDLDGSQKNYARGICLVDGRPVTMLDVDSILNAEPLRMFRRVEAT